MTEAVIKIENLSYTIGNKEILRGISFEITAGTSVSIIGANGAGKTTLLRCIDNIITEYAGKIFIDGQNINNHSKKNLAKLIAYVPQSAAFNAPFTVKEFVMMGRFPHLSAFSAISSEDDCVVENAMTTTEVQDFAGRLITTLSGGELQRVNIAAAIAQEAKTLLLDEPTTFLDYKHQCDIQNMLYKINKEKGITTIAVTHDINTAVMFSERIIAIKDGRIIFDGTGTEVMDNVILSEIYGKEFIFTVHPQTGQKLLIPQTIERGDYE